MAVRGNDAGAQAAVRLERLTRVYDRVHAVDGIDLDTGDGEFFSLLGPSGSGKTTTLRLIAGFERPTSGRVLLHGRDVSRVPPFDRDVNTVFQDFALFPHLNVAENVAYGLRVRRVGRDERRRRVREALATVRLEGFESRSTKAMSGGQRQRVALARALVNRPRVLLLDEPLGALDAKLRDEMQVELKKIQREVGITFIFVTHDQAEAFAMSDRIAVFNDGHIEQVGSPEEIYECPVTGFVAGFVGVSNVIDGKWAELLLGRRGTFLVRPEKIFLTRQAERLPPDRVRVTGRVAEATYQGPLTRVVVTADNGRRFVVSRQNVAPVTAGGVPHEGDPVVLSWEPAVAAELPASAREAADSAISDPTREPSRIGGSEPGARNEA